MRSAARVAFVPVLLLAAAGSPSSSLQAQDAAAVVQVADRDRAALNSSGALGRLDAGLSTAPANYDLLWRASRESADLGETASDPVKRAEYFRRAEGYARRAVAANAAGADGHFVLAVALGRTALSLGSRDRVRYAGEIHAEALTTLRLEPKHAGALHVLGVWNAEVMRLSSFSRFAARNFLGGKVFDQASWAEATRYLEEAVSVDPGRITHRLDLAKVYAETKQQPKARATCETALKMPLVELNDAHYKQECERLLATLR